MSSPDFIISDHAVSRLMDMAVTPEEVKRALTSPESLRYSRQPRVHFRTAGRVTLCVSDERDSEGRRCVVTALWASQSLWEADYAFPAPHGREPRRQRA